MPPWSRRFPVRLAAMLLLVTCGTAANAARPPIKLRVYANTGEYLNAIVWTGTRFVYVQNTANVVWEAGAAGTPLHRVSSMPKLVEEARCVLSPGAHGWPAGAIFCQAPNHVIYELHADGTSPTVFATLPAADSTASDGAIDFDRVGRFGYRLVAATGRSGAATPAGGEVFTVDPSGAVARVGVYDGPGGADEVLVAPASFGSAAGDALLTVDAGKTAGALVAMAPDGSTRTIARFPFGPNPIAAIPPTTTLRTAGSPPAGLYITDDTNPNVYFAPASSLARYAGDVIVGAEDSAQFFISASHGDDFTTRVVPNNLGLGSFSFEQAIYVP